ncbi:WD40-repeat-containing domain protein [Parasitella parasitica]|nr:WD40-repeat-containing domain protein [Parasitella parasitica]
MNYKIHVYTLDTITSPFKDPVKILVSENAARTGGGAESPYIINAIKVGKMLEKEILVSVSEMGEICIWKTEQLDEPPLILKYSNNGIATWGIAIHGDQGLLAVSANNFKITVYNISEMTTRFGKRSNKKPNYLQSAEKIELEGHEHNIPNIDFNETGRYIASVSVDTTCRIWDIVSKQMITQKRSSSRESTQHAWCWSTKFIKPGNFKHVFCADKEITKLYQQRLYQGRSTSLANLGLCHSANNPAFPINVSRVLDLEEEDIDFEIYEDEGEGELDDDIWDDRLLEEEDNFMEEVYERQRMEDEHEYNFGNGNDQGEVSETLQSTFQENVDEASDEADQEDEQLMLSLRSATAEHNRIEAGWTATITQSTDVNHDGWGDPLLSAEQHVPSTITGINETMQMDDTAFSDNNSPSYCIPNIIRITSNSSMSQLNVTPTITSEEPKYKNLGEYIMITTGKDVILASTTLPRMNKIRSEHDMINKVDIRSDQLLSFLDRINMVEWLPELELFVVASQKGTVALMRLLQVEFEDGHQECLFNNEHYLPINVLQSTPLYGMTVKKVDTERFAPVSYQIFLFYYSGNVLGYNVSRKDSIDTIVNGLFF